MTASLHVSLTVLAEAIRILNEAFWFGPVVVSDAT